MKYWVCALFALLASVARAETLVCSAGQCRMEFNSPDPNRAHSSANEFAGEVGRLLKVHYPSKVLEPRVKIEQAVKNGKQVFRFVWTCRIVKTSAKEADYFFDRRGTLWHGRTLEEAKEFVDRENDKKSRLVFRDGNWNKPAHASHSSFTASGEWWYVQEIFLTAPKQ